MNVEKTWLYTLVRIIFRFVFTCIIRLKVHGADNFLEDQNCILLSNHISALDPIAIAYAYKHNEIHYFGKDSLFKYKWIAAILRKLHAFPVKRGETDMKAMRTAMQVLKDGHVLGVFPEGHRRNGEELQPLETGVVVMALKGRVPVIPIMIQGQYRLFHRVNIVIGAPIILESYWAQTVSTEMLEEVKQLLMDALLSLRITR